MPQFQLDTSGVAVVHNPAFAYLKFSDLGAFTQGYIEAMFFMWPEDDGDFIGGISSPAFADLAPEALQRIIADCAEFQRANAGLLERAYDARIDGRGDKCGPGDYDETQAGRDFWFTRNGHGVGFWDRNLGKVGDALTEACRAWRELYSCLGDDGKVYCE